MNKPHAAFALVLCLCLSTPADATAADVVGWLGWRGPQQNGTSLEKKLPSKWEPGGVNHLWSVDLPGRGTPVIANGRVYTWGYRGQQETLHEVLMCLDEQTGTKIWEHRFNDFLSDIIYDRYTIGSPAIDAASGNIYLMSTAGELVCFDPDGRVLWQHSTMERFGRMTFPNGRTGMPAIDGNLVIINTISTNWGAQGPPRNRFYAFDKRTGEPVWASTPGVGPPFLKDSSFCTPVFAWDEQGRRVFYAGLGCGNVVKVNARTGEPIWRYQMSVGGVNASVVIHGHKLIAIHGKENVDSSRVGRMVALDLRTEPKAAPDGGTPLLDKSAEVWRIDGLAMFTSSPVLVADRVYQIDAKGKLHCLDVETGRELWQKRLYTSQLHASPLWADGKIYASMIDGSFWILKPTDQGAEVLTETKLEGTGIGSPAAWNGKVYVHTTSKLYCFGSKGDNTANLPPAPTVEPGPAPGKVARIQVTPDEVLLQPGQSARFRLTGIDALGHAVGPIPRARWEKYIPPTAKVKAKLDADFDPAGKLVAPAKALASAGAFRATALELPAEPQDVSQMVQGTIRGRILPSLPYMQDFESFDLNQTHPTEKIQFAYPPLPWIGARFKWDIRERDGSKVLTKTLDRVILQRAMTFLGGPDESDYTISADVMTDGNRRMAGEVGVINQRYMIVLKGNHDLLEVNSNHERLKVSVPFEIDPKKWYTLKARVDVAADGSGVVRAKAWARGEAEPDAWTIEVPHAHAHRKGSPGLFGFGPQNKVRVYADNLKITPNH